jgi:hypothetical protein
MTSGDVISWMILVPSGATVQNELWVDVNTNGGIDPGTDVLIFRFTQQDGGFSSDGPGDDDRSMNGVIASSFPAGIAPAMWLFASVHSSGADTASFTINPVSAPIATITGTVTVPAGFDKAYQVVEASPETDSPGMNIFWQGLTDASGNYVIALGGDPATQNPWRVQMGDFGVASRLIPVRRDTTVSIGILAAIVNFELIKGTILSGTIVEDGSTTPIEYAEVHTHPAPAGAPNTGDNYGSRTDAQGRYQFTVPPGDYLLHFSGPGYFDEYWDNAPDEQSATTIVVTTQDSLKNLDATLAKGGQISGRARNWGRGVNASITVFSSDSTVWIYEGSNDNGEYSVTVSPGSYYVMFEYQGSTVYYDQTTNFPSDLITVSGTESFTGIDADFSVGEPPLPEPPAILNIWDVPFDNGRHVYVKWTGIDRMFSMMDGSEGGFGIESYSIWRIDGADSVYLETVPAAMLTTYTAIAQTLKDSTKTEGAYMSAFIVRAHFIFNAFVLTSVPQSGYSLDNMAPGVPAGLGTVVSGSDVVLRWRPNEDEDFKYYSVYRSVTENFSVQGLTPYALTATTEFVDAGAATGTFYYRLTATDHAGNESDQSTLASSSGTTAAEVVDALPSSFALHRNYPNPFNPSTTISFDIPSQVNVRIVVYNAIGEEVAILVDGVRSAGSYTTSFDASSLASGLYFYRMQAGEFHAVEKMSLLK